MKRNLFFWLIGLICLAGCDDNDNNANTPTPNAAVTKAFSEKYPSATQVKWDNKSSYMTADFIYNSLSSKAWFDHNGQWYMTETELQHKNQLPEAVLTALTNSEYAAWTIDDMDLLERLDAEKLYVIEVKNGKQEYELYYSEDGVLIKAIPDDDNDDYEDYLPGPAPSSTITEFITDKYPGARIVEIEHEHANIEVDIIHDKRSKEVVFNAQEEWMNTHYDIRKNEAPSVVLQALANSAYGDYVIDDIEKYETPQGEYYLIELEKGNHEINVTIDSEGNLKQFHK